MYEHLAKEILVVIQNSIFELSHSPVAKSIVAESVQALHKIAISRDTILSQMKAIAKSLPEFYVIKEMSCIDYTLKTDIIAEIVDDHLFKNKHSLISYAGIDAPPYQLGSFNDTERHISKHCNSYLRKTGYKNILCFIWDKLVCNPVYMILSTRNALKVNAEKTMITVLNKILRIYYGRVI